MGKSGGQSGGKGQGFHTHNEDGGGDGDEGGGEDEVFEQMGKRISQLMQPRTVRIGGRRGAASMGQGAGCCTLG